MLGEGDSPMQTECTQVSFRFHPLSQRDVVARFDGGSITSDGGGLLLREVERRTGILRQFSACFTDHRNPLFIEHSVLKLVGQRVYGLALGTRTSTTTTSCGGTRCWRLWWGRWTRRERI